MDCQQVDQILAKLQKLPLLSEETSPFCHLRRLLVIFNFLPVKQ